MTSTDHRVRRQSDMVTKSLCQVLGREASVVTSASVVLAFQHDTVAECRLPGLYVSMADGYLAKASLSIIVTVQGD